MPSEASITGDRGRPRWYAAVAISLPALALIAGARALHPAGAGFLGIPVFLGTLILAGLGFALSDRDGRRAPAPWFGLGLVLVLGALASGLYWQHVWSYRHYDMGGIPLVLFYVFAFWWPGLFVAAASRFLERGLGPMPRRSWLGRLAAGAAAGALGAGGYEIADDLYHRSRDRVPFAEAAGPLAPPWPGIEPGSPVVVHDPPLLLVRARMDPTAVESSYEVLGSVEDYLLHVRDLLSRKDTDEARVEIRSPAGPFLEFRATDADSARPLRELYRMDRALLPEEGLLRAVDVERMIRVPSDELRGSDQAATFERVFRARVEGDTLALRFEQVSPPAPETFDLQAAAWVTANRARRETARFFPEIRFLRLHFPALDTVLDRDVFVAERFRLQHLLLPRDSLLGLRVSDGGPARTALDPGTFHPSGEPIETAQIAVLRISGPLEQHVAGLLYEGILVETGRIHVTEIYSAGAIELLYAPWQGRVEGPARIERGGTAWLGDVKVDHLGWFPGAGFPSPEPDPRGR